MKIKKLMAASLTAMVLFGCSTIRKRHEHHQDPSGPDGDDRELYT